MYKRNCLGKSEHLHDIHTLHLRITQIWYYIKIQHATHDQTRHNLSVSIPNAARPTTTTTFSHPPQFGAAKTKLT